MLGQGDTSLMRMPLILSKAASVLPQPWAITTRAMMTSILFIYLAIMILIEREVDLHVF